MFRLSLCTILLALLFSASSVAQPSSSEKAATHIRALVLKGSYDQAVTEGKALLATHDDSELKAWYLVGLTRSGAVQAANETADLMVAMEGENPWSWFAKAAACIWGKDQQAEARAASDKALALNPEHPDFVWLRGQALLADGTPENLKRLETLLEKYDTLVRQHPELTALKGRATAPRATPSR